MENADFVDTFWGVITKQTIFWVHFYAFTGLFLSSMYRTGIFFVGCLFVVVVVVLGGGG